MTSIIAAVVFASALPEVAEQPSAEAAAEVVPAETATVQPVADAQAAVQAAAEAQLAQQRRIETRTFRLHHLSAVEMAESINQMWSGDFGETWKIQRVAVAFPESNSIMVTAPRTILDACESSIRELDIEAQQVYIEARFVALSMVTVSRVVTLLTLKM